ncbi:PLAC8-domain-containing protein [Colletotrichum falcatum]|nr:PLAC8-domain-containing protein [Colletotrichum falcatum]
MTQSQSQYDSKTQQAQTHTIQSVRAEQYEEQGVEWSHSFCGFCASCEQCLLGTFLPCLLFGQTSHRLEEPSMENYSRINCNCVLLGLSCLAGCGWMAVMRKRFQIRQRYNIRGSDAGDCCASYWCISWTLVQHEREVLARQSIKPNTEGYQKEPAMDMKGEVVL